MNPNLYITSYCKIKNNTIIVDDEVVFKDENEEDYVAFFKKAYKENPHKYSKFFKMDNLCKLAFLSAEFLVQKTGELSENTAVVLSNKAASLDTDRKHQATIQEKDNFYPSPAVFVYTLPNIAMGELSIRHHLQTENAFFVSEQLNEQLLFNYTEVLIGNKKANHVLCAWVNIDGNEYESFMYLVSDKGKLPHKPSSIKELYRK